MGILPGLVQMGYVHCVESGPEMETWLVLEKEAQKPEAGARTVAHSLKSYFSMGIFLS